MKVYLLYPDKDFNMNKELPPNWQDLVLDLGLDVMLSHMSGSDKFLFNISNQVLSSFETDINVIRYRQDILKDTLKNVQIVRELYEVPIKVKEEKRRNWVGIYGFRTPSSVLTGARGYLSIQIEGLRELKKIAELYAHSFESAGFKRFFKMIREELTDGYLSTMEKHIEDLKFPNGVWASVNVGKGCEGDNYILRYPKEKGWLEKLVSKTKTFSYKLHPRDDAGAKVLEELRNISIARVAQSVACACEHIERFFERLQQELAFYLACANLVSSIKEIDMPLAFPHPLPYSEKKFESEYLYDLNLALTSQKKVVGNKMNSIDKDIFIIMGANKGGKTTFLRSIGQAQIMMQAGMFVPASFYSAPIVNSLFTHFKREEDKELKLGKFEEELRRMRTIVDNLKSNSMVLFNESFSSTNEYEGSEVAYQIIKALSEEENIIYFVTHMYALASKFIGNGNTMFLEAERKPDGERTYKIIESEPAKTSYATDVYKRIFENK